MHQDKLLTLGSRLREAEAHHYMLYQRVKESRFNKTHRYLSYFINSRSSSVSPVHMQGGRIH